MARNRYQKISRFHNRNDDLGEDDEGDDYDEEIDDEDDNTTEDLCQRESDRYLTAVEGKKEEGKRESCRCKEKAS